MFNCAGTDIFFQQSKAPKKTPRILLDQSRPTFKMYLKPAQCKKKLKYTKHPVLLKMLELYIKSTII